MGLGFPTESAPVGKKPKLFHKLLIKAVLGIQIRNRIRMFLGLRDPDPLVRGMDLAPDPPLFPECVEWTEIMLDKIEF
jgi:hypothetical protein